MSRAIRVQENAGVGQLKKELTDASTALQAVKSRIESIEKIYSDSQQALTNDKNLKLRVKELEERFDELKSQKQHDDEAFATAIQNLNHTHGGRLRLQLQGLEDKTKEQAEKFAAAEKDLQQKLDTSRREIQVLQNTEEMLRRQKETEAVQRTANMRKLEASHKLEMDKRKTQADRQEARISILIKETDEQSTMLKGRDTEVIRLQSRLDSLQKFSMLPLGKAAESVKDIQDNLQSYCNKFISNADALPGWRPIPNQLKSSCWPENYSLDQEHSRGAVLAILQNSICNALTEHIFLPLPFCSLEVVNLVDGALHHSNQCHHAIWRVMSASVMLSNKEIMTMFEDKCRATAQQVVELWNLHKDPELRGEMEGALVEFLMHCLESWLNLMELKDRTVVATTGSDEIFDYGGEGEADQSRKLPGAFTSSTPSQQLFCMFPAFILTSAISGTMSQHVLHRGTALLSDSKVFVLARQEFNALSSPKSARRSNTVSSVG